MKALSRRTLLRGTAGGVAIGLPWLSAMAGKSSAAEFPKRFLVFFSADGTIPEAWTPSGGETDFVLGEILSPLEPYRDKLLILDNINNEVANVSDGDGHQTGMGCMLTGMQLLPGTEFCEGDCSDPTQTIGWGGGISVDQHIANKISAETITKFRSLEMGVQVQDHSVWSRMSYLGPDQPVPARDDPWQNFTDIFADLGADPFGLQQLIQKRHSVLDVVIPQYEKLRTRVGGEDKVKLEQHLDAIREIEKRLDVVNQLGGSCQLPVLGDPQDIYDEQNYPLLGQLQMDMLVMALACDLTRVGSIQWHTSVSNKHMSWLGISEGHHDLSHEGDENLDARNKLIQINKWYAEQFAYLVGALDAVPEGTGTMLDNTVVLWCNELGVGNSHSRDDEPFVLAGSCQGYFQTGRYLSYNGESHCNLLTSLVNAMGYPDATFGDPAYCDGPLAGLTG
jgi:uncharacterized protein DUF1552